MVRSSPISSQPPPDLLPAGWAKAGAPPLEIDVGCHKGLFLSAMAALHPDRHFLGIERQSDRVERTRRKIRAGALANAAVVRADGAEALRALPAACADVIHVLFPDPWPKRRHAARRLVQSAFLADCARVLRDSGMLRLVTDDASYAAEMQAAADESPLFSRGDDARDYPATEFQKKFAAAGRPVFTGIFLRRPGPPDNYPIASR